jgi:hypothetical protein
MGDDHSVGLGQRECGSSVGTSSAASSGGSGIGSGRSCAEGLGEIEGRVSMGPVLGELGAGRRRAGVRGSESINDIFRSNCRDLKRRKCEYPRSETEAGPLLTGMVNASFGREAVTCYTKEAKSIRPGTIGREG